ncbi:MAG: aldehyde dehydrogenase family protein, partial [Pseudomonadota bacterium]
MWTATAETLPVEAPSDGSEIGRIASGGADHIDAAVGAARTALQGDWGRSTAVERGRILHAIGQAIAAEHEELARLEALDTGKPLSQARVDVTCAARYFEYYGAAADKVHGDSIPFLNGYQVMTVHEPHGVTGHIIPWNYPVQMIGRSCAAALAMGNACVLKPAEEASLTALRLGQIALDCGLPSGALNVVPGLGETAGAALTAHPDVNFLSFTGSPEVGALVQAAAAQNHIGCTLELGGKSPQIVFADADLDTAVATILKAIVQNGGQTCSAGSRVLVEQAVHGEVTDRLAERFKTLTAGAWDADLDLGALISARQKARVERYIEAAGAPLA